VLCIGGTGAKVGTQLKARFVESLGYVPRNVMITALDGANDPIAMREGRNGGIVALEWGAERHQFESVPVANILKYLAQHPEIEARFGRDSAAQDARLRRRWRGRRTSAGRDYHRLERAASDAVARQRACAAWRSAPKICSR
jgi:hypothetical protein